MERRELLKTITGLATVGAAFQGRLVVVNHSPIPLRRYGLVTVRSHMAHERATGEHLHVFFNGADVTRNCSEADDVFGYVVVLCRDACQHEDWTKDGALHIGGDGGACRLRMTGNVIIAPGPKPSVTKEAS